MLERRHVHRGLAPIVMVAFAAILAVSTGAHGQSDPSPSTDAAEPEARGIILERQPGANGPSDAQRQADTNECYEDAASAMRQSDSNFYSGAARQRGSDMRGYADLEDNVRAYSGQKRFEQIFTDCMKRKSQSRSGAAKQ